jgi:hypothetical protein
MSFESQQPVHSPAWVVQVWISFAVSMTAVAVGLVYAPIDPWIRAFLAISVLMAISSAISLSKTLRDLHESTRLVKKIDDARVTKLLAETPPGF